MDRKHLVAAACAGLAVAAAAPMSAAQAAGDNASGSYQFTGATMPIPRTAGDHVILDGLTATVAWTGTFTGTSTLTGRLTLRPIDGGNPLFGTANYQYTDVFVGTVNGVPGTMTLLEEGQTGRDGIVHSKDVVVSATGGLVGLTGMVKGTGTVSGENGPAGTYLGTVSMP
ncbi:MAG: hypothetical protein QOI82_1104 [Actinomycetota bacterium]|jgi:hypothetical protein|nr:hypothetical protein [Actinomycetota bacterium]